MVSGIRITLATLHIQQFHLLEYIQHESQFAFGIDTRYSCRFDKFGCGILTAAAAALDVCIQSRKILAGGENTVLLREMLSFVYPVVQGILCYMSVTIFPACQQIFYIHLRGSDPAKFIYLKAEYSIHPVPTGKLQFIR